MRYPEPEYGSETMRQGARRIYLGRVPQGDGRPPEHVWAEVSLVDHLNPHDRQKETVTHETVRYGDVPHVSITWTYGTAREVRRGDGSGGAGVPLELLEGIEDPDDRRVALRLSELAERWHLSMMRAGCIHQSADGRSYSLSERWPDPCPETGYPYGSAWLVEVPPAEVVAELETIGADR